MKTTDVPVSTNIRNPAVVNSSLIRELRERFPARLFRPPIDVQEVAFHAGQQELIAYLEARLEQQTRGLD